MSLKDSFKEVKGHRLYKLHEGGAALFVHPTSSPGGAFFIYDFVSRIMVARSGDNGVSVTPFSQLDRETLEFYREELIRLNGNPPELPALENSSRTIDKNIPKVQP